MYFTDVNVKTDVEIVERNINWYLFLKYLLLAITDVMSYLVNKLAMRKKPPQQGFCGVEQKTEYSTNGNYILSHKYIHI